MAILLRLFAAAFLATEASAQSQVSRMAEQRSEALTAALTSIRAEEWRPMPTDPRWLEIKRELDEDIIIRPRGEVAKLARSAAVRIEPEIRPLVSQGTPAIALDTRPWFELSTAMPYAIDLHASLDGGPWVQIASASSGASCVARLAEIVWPSSLRPGFHRVALLADVTFVRASRDDRTWCTFLTAESSATEARWPRPSTSRILGRERRGLASLSFALFEPFVNPFAVAGRFVPARVLDPSLPDVPLESWLTFIVGTAPEGHFGARINWHVEYCNEDEALWYPGDTASNQNYWRAGTAARRKARALCAIALSGQSEGRILHVLTQIATVIEDTGIWTAVTPTVFSAFITGVSNVLYVPTLASLPELIQVPENFWPRVDLTVFPIDIIVTPSQPKPGDLVTIQIGVTNIGSVEARYAHGVLTICPRQPCTWPNIHQDVVGQIPVGGTLTVERSMVLPDGMGGASLCMEVWPPNGAANGLMTMVQDSTPEDNCVVLEIGPRGARRLF